MAESFVPECSNQSEELEFWKNKCEEKQKELSDLEHNFNEFQESSRDLEAEMEKDLERSEKKIKDLTISLEKMKEDYEQQLEKARRNTEESSKLIHSLQAELEKNGRSQRDLLREKQRLEEENDNLERKERQLTASLQDITEKSNRLLEENAWLQTELEEQKLKSQEVIQRFRDEVRELQLELSVANNPNVSSTSDGDITHVSDSKDDTKPNGFPHLTQNSSDVHLVNELLCLVRDMEQRFSETHNRPSPNVSAMTSVMPSLPISTLLSSSSSSSSSSTTTTTNNNNNININIADLTNQISTATEVEKESLLSAVNAREVTSLEPDNEESNDLSTLEVCNGPAED